jgi:hypothetical protein
MNWPILKHGLTEYSEFSDQLGARMRIICFLFLLLLTACGDQLVGLRDQFSSLTDSVVDMTKKDIAQDRSPGGSNIPIVPDDEVFLSIKNTWETKCLNCHMGYHTSHDAFFESATVLASSAWVVAGNPNSSLLYNRLQGSSGANATMPLEDTLTLGELSDVEDWILALDNSSSGGSAGSTSGTDSGSSTGGSTSGGSGGSSNQELFAAYQQVIQNRCVGCHNINTPPRTRFDYNTAEEHIANDLVVPGNLNLSYSWFRLNNNGGNMPPGGANLSQAELNAISNMIMNYNQN